jgi:hypothetical protein
MLMHVESPETLPPVYTYRTQKKAKISDFQDFHGGRLKGKVPNSKENSKPRWPRVMRSESKNAKRSVVVGKNIRAGCWSVKKSGVAEW